MKKSVYLLLIAVISFFIQGCEINSMGVEDGYYWGEVGNLGGLFYTAGFRVKSYKITEASIQYLPDDYDEDSFTYSEASCSFEDTKIIDSKFTITLCDQTMIGEFISSTECSVKFNGRTITAEKIYDNY